ncbi:MAG TPA: hypothetical protein PLL30_16995 [Candidatus Krumholzibacteria bacterium]|nr:hypothetical protein [Candidatus Krumholzibacteria bacterium]HRY42195.1 hypothetical protein [Candidatus Krumholzibacteria bacterium]
MRTMQLHTDSFDRKNTFRIRCGRDGYAARASLHRGMLTRDDGVLWVLQHASCIASSYSADEIAERERLAAEAPVVNGEIVEVEGEKYRVRVIGDYSDCAILDPVEKTLDPLTNRWVAYDPATGAYL